MKSDSIEYDIYVVPEGCDEWQYHSSYATRPLATRTARELGLLWPEWRVIILQRRMHAISPSRARDRWTET